MVVALSCVGTPTRPGTCRCHSQVCSYRNDDDGCLPVDFVGAVVLLLLVIVAKNNSGTSSNREPW